MYEKGISLSARLRSANPASTIPRNGFTCASLISHSIHEAESTEVYSSSRLLAFELHQPVDACHGTIILVIAADISRNANEK
jgi:hypothetical protein